MLARDGVGNARMDELEAAAEGPVDAAVARERGVERVVRARGEEDLALRDVQPLARLPDAVVLPEVVRRRIVVDAVVVVVDHRPELARARGDRDVVDGRADE